MQVPCKALPLLVSSVAAHGWVTRPPAVNLGAADHDIDHIDLPNWPSYTTSWYQNGLTCPGTEKSGQKCGNVDNNFPGKCPASCPGEVHTLGSCGVHNNCIKKGSKDPWHDQWEGQKECDARHSLGSTKNPFRCKAGANIWVAWTVTANHGGTVGWRLCPLDKVGTDYGPDGATEKCFQAHHLEFTFERTHVQCTNGNGGFSYKAEHVVGAGGKKYRKTIIERCSSNPKSKTPEQYCQNPDPDHPPCTQAGDPAHAAFSLKDNVLIPANLAPGKYALSWRWDCERTPQVWMNCAEIEILPADLEANVTDLLLL